VQFFLTFKFFLCLDKHIKVMLNAFQELVSSAGRWYPERRRLSIPAGLESRVWGAHDTVAVKIPGAFWLPSGATHLNWLACYSGVASIDFNEVRTIPPTCALQVSMMLTCFSRNFKGFHLAKSNSILVFSKCTSICHVK
jgi:hypothetical protein